jgi:hypothetical protein
LPQGGPTPLSGWHRGSRSERIAEVVFAAQAAGSGVERWFGCSYRRSVAEVGESHLSGVVEVSREASQEGAG